jgi:hypothetical protein
VGSPTDIRYLGYYIWILTLTGETDFAIITWIRFVTAGTLDNITSMLLFQEMKRNRNVLDAANTCPSLLDLFHKKFEVLFFLRLQLEKPVLDLGPCFDLSWISKNTYPATV